MEKDPPLLATKRRKLLKTLIFSQRPKVPAHPLQPDPPPAASPYEGQRCGKKGQLNKNIDGKKLYLGHFTRPRNYPQKTFQRQPDTSVKVQAGKNNIRGEKSPRKSIGGWRLSTPYNVHGT
jgi:hypothetical protein